MLMAAMMVAAMSLQAQKLFLKPMAGGTLATLTDTEDSKLKLGFVAGAELGFHIINPLAITAGALYSVHLTRALCQGRHTARIPALCKI